MRTLALILALSLVSLIAAAPTASAGHCCGPCTHEWFDIVLYTYDGFKQGGAKGAAQNFSEGARYCTIGGGGVGSVCDIIRCD